MKWNGKLKNEKQIVYVIIGLLCLVDSGVGVRQLLQQEECFEVSPNDLYTCEEQKKWGKCNEDWIVQGEFCERTCGRCGAQSQTSTYNSGCQDMQPDEMSCQEYRDIGKCSEQQNSEQRNFCDVTCGRCDDSKQSEVKNAKQCRLTNCTVIDFYDENPFLRTSGGKRRKLLYAYAQAEASSSVFVNPQPANNPFGIIPITTQRVQSGYTDFVFPQIIITEDRPTPQSFSVNQNGNNNNNGLSIFIPEDDKEPSKNGNLKSDDQPDFEITINPDQISATTTSVFEQQPTYTQPSQAPPPVPLSSPPPPSLASVLTPQGGIVAFPVVQQPQLQEDDQEQKRMAVDYPGLSLLYGDSAVLDPGSSAFAMQDPARAAVARLELSLFAESCMEDFSVFLLDPCCEQYTVQQGEQICDIASRYDVSCEELKQFNDLTSVSTGQIIQIC